MIIDKVLINLEKLRNDEWITEWIDYGSGKFHKDWLSNREVEWGENLKGLLKQVERVKQELSDRLKITPEIEDPFRSDDKPNINDNLYFKKFEQAGKYLPKLDKLEEGIKNSLNEYDEKKDQNPYLITYIRNQKIPFIGIGQTLGSIMALLVDSGFLAVNDKLSNASLEGFGHENRKKFKNMFITKKKLSEMISNYFYCIEADKYKKDISERILDPITINKKLGLENLKRLDDDILNNMVEKFENILRLIKEARDSKNKNPSI